MYLWASFYIMYSLNHIPIKSPPESEYFKCYKHGSKNYDESFPNYKSICDLYACWHNNIKLYQHINIKKWKTKANFAIIENSYLP